MNEIGAVVVAYNNENTLSKCLKSLRLSGIEDIVVVDNHSADGSVRKARQENAKCLVQSVNLGFAAAVNIGAKELSNKYILLLNPDAHLLSRSIKVPDRVKEKNDIGVAGLFLCDNKGQIERNSFGPTVTPLSMMLRKFRRQKLPVKTAEAGWVSGGAMLVRRDVFEKLGGFDESFFMYWEDIDFCCRVKKAGYKVVVTPDIKVVHKRGDSLSDSVRKAKLYDQSADRYFYKHYSKAVWQLHRQLKRFYRLFWRRAR